MPKIKKSFFRKIPRAKVYLGLPLLITTAFKILFKKPILSKKTAELEQTLQNYFGFSEKSASSGKEVIMFSRARLALFYLLKNLELPEGSELIMTPLTIADIFNAVRWAKLTPVFCDLGKNTYNIDYKKLEETITPKTKVLFITHLTGIATDMDEIEKIVKKYNLILIEDVSQAFGAEFSERSASGGKGKKLGTFGVASISSISFLKTFCTLSGGILIINEVNSLLAKKIKNEIKNLPPPPKKFLLKETIRNIVLNVAANKIIFSVFTYYVIKIFNILHSNAFEEFIKSNPPPVLTDTPPQKLLFAYSDLQAEIGLKILKNVAKSDDKRIENVKTFIENLSPDARRYLPYIPENAKNVFWRLPFEIENPDTLKSFLFKNYIDTTRTNLMLCSEVPAFHDYTKNTPNAKKAHSPIFIPIHSDFTQKDMLYMAQVINEYLKKAI